MGYLTHEAGPRPSGATPYKLISPGLCGWSGYIHEGIKHMERRFYVVGTETPRRPYQEFKLPKFYVQGQGLTPKDQ